MYIGTQYEPANPTPDYYRHLKQLGVDYICSTPPGSITSWTVESLSQHREELESFGLTLDMIPLGHIGIGENDPWRAIMLGAPERDQAIEGVCEVIRRTAAAGIPAMKYYLHYLGVVSTGHVPGRGDSQNRTFVYEDAAQEPLTAAGRVDADAMRVYKEVGYPYMIMPDHVPHIAGPAPDLVAFGFALGYQKALLQAVEHLA